MIEREQGEREVNILAIYLHEANEAPLLTGEQEQELARQRDLGKVAEVRLKELEKNGLKPEERKELEPLITQGKEAKEGLISSNLRLVVSIAKKNRGRGVPFLDLIQEGNLGLMRAVDKFDPDRGNRFSTHAIWWIRQAIGRAVAYQGRTIRIPVHRIELLTQIGKVKRNLSLQLEGEPTIDEIARQLGKEPQLIEETLRQAIPPFSLDKEVKIEGETAMIELIEDGEAFLPPQESEVRLLGTEVRKQLETLTEREKRVLELRFGLNGGPKRTLGEIGQEFGLTRERIRQIKVKALRKLRHPLRARKLKDYLE